MREPIRVWRGVNNTLDPQLLEEGELVRDINMHARHGSLEKRLGFSVVQSLGFPGRYYWPALLFNFLFPDPSIPEVKTGFEGDEPFYWIGGYFLIPPYLSLTQTVPFTDNPLAQPPVFNLPPVLILPELPEEVKANVPFFLTITAFTRVGGAVATAYDGTDAVFEHQIYIEPSGVVTVLNPLVLEGGGPIVITNPVDWVFGVWRKKVKFLDEMGGNRLAVSTFIRVSIAGGGDTAKIVTDLYLHWKWNEPNVFGDQGPVLDHISTNTGEMLGTASRVASPMGNALSLSSPSNSTQLVKPTLRAAIDGDFTMTCIFRAGVQDAGTPFFFSPIAVLSLTADQTDCLIVGIVNTGVDLGKLILLELNGTGVAITSSVVVTDNAWHTFKLYRYQGTYSLEIDTVDQGNSTVTRGEEAFGYTSINTRTEGDRLQAEVDDYKIVPGAPPFSSPFNFANQLGQLRNGQTIDGIPIINAILEIPSNPTLNPPGSFSIACWLRAFEVSDSGTILSKWNVPGVTEYRLRKIGADLDFTFDSTGAGGPGGSVTYLGALPNPRAWFFVIAEFDVGAGVCRIEVNRGAATVGPPVAGSPIFAGGTPFRIGATGAPPAIDRGNFRIHGLSLHNAILTVPQKDELYNLGVPLLYTQFSAAITALSSMVSYLPLHETSTNMRLDQHGANHLVEVIVSGKVERAPGPVHTDCSPNLGNNALLPNVCMVISGMPGTGGVGHWNGFTNGTWELSPSEYQLDTVGPAQGEEWRHFGGLHLEEQDSAFLHFGFFVFQYAAMASSFSTVAVNPNFGRIRDGLFTSVVVHGVTFTWSRGVDW